MQTDKSLMFFMYEIKISVPIKVYNILARRSAFLTESNPMFSFKERQQL
jgi:hypothetical protein